MGAATVVQLIIVAAVAASALYMSHQLSKKLGQDLNTGTVAQDEGPSTNVNRGSFVPYLIGQRRLGILYGWTGNRVTNRSSLAPVSVTKGRKKSRKRAPAPSTEIGFFEEAFAPICVGPAIEMIDVFVAGKPVLLRGNRFFPDFFTPTTVPSGSGVLSNFPTPGNFRFRVYWGELDQPGDPTLTDPVTGMGSVSRWPGVMYLFIQGFLGNPPRWPLLDVEMVTTIVNTGTVSLALSTPDIVSTTYPDGRSGLNGAHILAQLLFGTDPYGMGLDPNLFDIPSLEVLGTTLETEGILSSSVGEDGETFKSMIGQLMQDMGVMISWDTDLGKWRFVTIRSPVTTPVIPSNMVLNKPIEIKVRHSEQQIERSVFRFFDVERRYRPSTIDVGSDSATVGGRGVKVKTVQLRTVIDHETASRVAERRSQEALGNEGRYKMTLDRRASALYPGRTFFIQGTRPRLLVITNKLDTLSGQVKIEAMEDSMGVGLSSLFLNPPPEGPPLTIPAASDEDKKIIEVPLFLLTPTDAPTIFVPRIRNNAQIVRADMHLSDDNVTYSLIGSSLEVQTGGVLAPGNPLPIGVPILETGPEVTLLGPPDDDTLEDLAAKQAEWRAGVQVVCMGSELMFVREVISVGGGRWRLDGVIRARMGTFQESHLANDPVFIFDPDDVFNASDAIMVSANEIFVKTQPSSLGQITDLALETPASRILYMTGHRPLPPVNLRVRGAVNQWSTTDDVILEWSYKSRGGGQSVTGNNGSGAGMSAGGLAVSDAPPEGDDFLLRIFDDPLGANTLVHTETVLPGANGLQSFTFTNADLQTFLGAEETFGVELTERGNALESSPPLLLIVTFV